jgi:acyl-CoA synthetase (AMP-forming)/AMP-acid ligase II
VFSLIRGHDEAPALIDAARGRAWTYAELRAEVNATAGRVAGPRTLVFVLSRPDVGSIVAYLAACAAGHAVVLVDGEGPQAKRAALEERYRPGLVLQSAEDGVLIEDRPDSPPVLHEDLRLMLSTSGTTGSPKLVRLTAANVLANAESIAAYLGLDDGERAIASLPFHYSYGLSVLNSHLLAGGSIVLPGESIMRPGFWAAFAEHACTSFAGVPYSYAILRRTGFERLELPSLRTMTQAGGRMEPDHIRHFHALLAGRGARLCVMYGQTEATARIAYVPPARLPEKAGSIGVAIPNGTLTVDEGELVYAGPNVMLGYAETREELARGDDQQGVLRTGDLGHVDDDGFHFITGRAKRFVKLFGLRISLDEVEAAARVYGPAAATGRDDHCLVVFREAGHGGPALVELARSLSGAYGLPPRAVQVREIERLPVTTSGKIDYAALRS